MEERVGSIVRATFVALLACLVVSSVASAHNGGPTANAGADQEIVAGASASFSASGSNASSGHNLILYSWNFGDSGSGSNSGTGQSVTHAYTTEGTYTVSLTVTDDESPANTATDTATVTVRANDTVAPTINHTQPSTTPTAGSAINITSNVTDNVAVSAVTLFYKNTTGSSYVNTTMTRVGTSAVYYASIPGTVTTANVNYYIQAVDTKPGTPNSALLPAGAPSTNFTINVSDSQAPTVTHTATTSGTASTAVNLTADVTDNLNVSIVQIKYRVGTSGTFTTVNMSRGTGTNWTGQIPASAVTSSGVQYWIKGQDASQNNGTAPSGADEVGSAVYTIGVSSALAPTVTHTNLTSATAGTDSTVTAVVAGNGGRGITNVSLFYKTGNSSTWVLAPSSAFNNLSVATTYTGALNGSWIDDKGIYYYINATDSSNETASKPSAGRADPYFVPAPPGTPASLATTRTGYTTMSLTWTAPTTTTNNTVSYYKVYRRGSTSTGTAAALSTGTTVTSASYTDTGLTNGTAYLYNVSAVDAFGNEGALTTEVLGKATPGSPSGLVAYRNGTATMNLVWTAPSTTSNNAAAYYKVYRKPANTTETLTALSTGTSVTTTSYSDTTVVDGTAYNYTVAAVDASGNEGSQSTERLGGATFVAASTTTGSSGDSGSTGCTSTAFPSFGTLTPSDGATVTNTARPTISAAYTGNGALTTTQLKLDGTAQTSGPSFGTSSVSFTPAANLTNGSHTINVTIANCFGSRSTGWTFTVSVTTTAADTTLPVIAGVTPTDGSTVTDATPTIGADYSDNVGIDVAVVSLKLDGSAVSATAGATSVAFTPTVALSDGSHAVSLTVKDAAGNAATKNWTFIVNTVPAADTTKPAFGNASPADGSTVETNKPEIAITYSDNVGVVASSVTLTLDGTRVTSGVTTTANGLSFTPSTALANGSHAVVVSVADAAGNTATESWSFTVTLPDTESPKIVSLVAPAAGSKVKGTIAISAIVTDNVRVTKVEFFVDGEKVNLEVDPPYDFSIDTTDFKDGTHTIKAIAYDAAGNTVAREVTVTIENGAAKPASKPLIPGPGVALALLAIAGAVALRRRK